jgi:hypothetical protein
MLPRGSLMPALPALLPNGDGTIATAVITRSSGAGTYFSHIDEDPTSGQPDSDYLYNAGAAGGDSHFDLTATPTDFEAMSALSAVTYCVPIGRTDDNIELRIGVFAADETTRYAGDSGGTQGAIVSGASNPSGLHTTTLTLTAAGLAATKADWDAARVRANWIYTQSMSKDAYDLRLHALRLTGTYTAVNPNATKTPGVITAVAGTPTASPRASITPEPAPLPVVAALPATTIRIGAVPSPSAVPIIAALPAALITTTIEVVQMSTTMSMGGV